MLYREIRGFQAPPMRRQPDGFRSSLTVSLLLCAVHRHPAVDPFMINDYWVNSLFLAVPDLRQSGDRVELFLVGYADRSGLGNPAALWLWGPMACYKVHDGFSRSRIAGACAAVLVSGHGLCWRVCRPAVTAIKRVLSAVATLAAQFFWFGSLTVLPCGSQLTLPRASSVRPETDLFRGSRSRARIPKLGRTYLFA